MDHHIVIIGAGPRGTYCLRRLGICLEKNPLGTPVRIHVIEKSGNFGGGGVHSVAQPEYLLLNTIGSQITAFGDDDEKARASDARKTLHGWLTSQGISIGPNDYPSRAQHGRYLADAFDWSQTHMPPGVTVHRHHAQAVDIESDENSGQTVVLDDGTRIRAEEVLLLTGHAKGKIPPGSPPEQWGKFAERCQKRGKRASYVHLVYPISEKTRHIDPGENVYVIGMGLTAVDVVKTLTIGRGGHFADGKYVASGREPFIILGSRLGLPYSARGRNEKNGQYKGKILTPRRMHELKQGKAKIDFVADILPLIREEMAYVYYATLLGEEFGARLLGCESESARSRLISESVPPEDRFFWEDLENPLRHVASHAAPDGPWFSSMTAYTRFVLDTLRRDIAEAKKGNMTSPIKTAVDAVLRDLRDVLRLVVDRGGLTAESHRWFDKRFNRMNNRIAVGPPASSTQELLILTEANILSFSGPSPKLTMDETKDLFYVENDRVPGSKRPVTHVLNGRIHGVSIENDSSMLVQNLIRRGMIRNFVNTDVTGEYELGGMDVNDEFQIIGADGNAHPHICALGIPLEGKFWFNAADARPDVDSNAIGQLSRWAGNAVGRLRNCEISGGRSDR